MASVTATAVELEERLRRHSAAFTQLLNLIPAKNYFAVGDGSTQWNKRKQTKEESQRAKKAKLDPDAIITTSDYARQQHLLEGTADPDSAAATAVLEVRSSAEEPAPDEPLTKRQKKQQKKAAAAATTPKKSGKPKAPAPAAEDDDNDDGASEAEEIQLSGFTFSTDLTAASPPAPPTTPSKPPAAAGTAAAGTATISPEKRQEQKARLEARIQALRAKRNADSPDGTPARNRNELMAARRKEEAQTRKERKKEQRTRQREKGGVRPGGSSGSGGGGGGGGGGVVVMGTPVPGTPVPAASPAPAAAAVVAATAPGVVKKPAQTPDGGRAGKAAERHPKKKAGPKKSRPGFEGSIKAGKGGNSKKGKK